LLRQRPVERLRSRETRGGGAVVHAQPTIPVEVDRMKRHSPNIGAFKGEREPSSRYFYTYKRHDIGNYILRKPTLQPPFRVMK
jgi:hypothetical protein